ncbi:Uncharacterised protein [Moraxella caprae]|uniref:DUF3899 domain-containing protein n=2 Tax=Moraxella caprae TaxID=90240 RepID=A0A378R106_9GAMM|nr:hypothetical protein [Moraxella caprae]STZ08885.1 Uncharacterised protein [Moraxella caprae]
MTAESANVCIMFSVILSIIGTKILGSARGTFTGQKIFTPHKKLYHTTNVLFIAGCYVICQQLEMLYQDIRQSLLHIKQDITGNNVVFYHKSSVKNIRIKTPKFYQVKQGLPLVYQAFSLTLFVMIISSVALMFVKAGF